MAKGVVIKSDYCNNNYLQILQKDDGDIVIRTVIRDATDKNVEIATKLDWRKENEHK